MGRHKKSPDKLMVQKVLRVLPDQAARVEALAEKHQVAESRLLREAIRLGMPALVRKINRGSMLV